MNNDPEIESIPLPTDILQGFRATRKDPKGFVKFLKIYKNVNNAPFVFDADDIPSSLRVLVLSHFEAYPASMNEAAERTMWERSEDADYFAALLEKESQNLLTVADSHLGTHTAKVPNPGVTGPGGLFADKAVFAAASTGAHVSSATFEAKQKVGAAGNAAQGKAQRFLASRVQIGERIVDVSDDIASKGVIYDSMGMIGFDPAVLIELSGLLEARLAGTGDSTPGLNAKGLIWPTEDGDVVITPVHAYAMHVELAARLKARKSNDSHISTTRIVVGGAKPQNAGLVNSDMGGSHRLLKSRPPAIGDSAQRRLFRISKTGEIPVGELTPTSIPMKEFIASAKAVWSNNAAARAKLERHVVSLVRISVIPLVEASLVDARLLEGKEFQKLSKFLRDLLVIGFDRMENRSEAVRYVSDRVIDQIPDVLEWSDALRRLFDIASEHILSTHFKGA